MPPALRIPITNIYGEGDYTAQIMIGSVGAPANVLLDTGSSTLAINSAAYDPGSDSSMQPTRYAQDIVYDTGSWTGPVVKTDIAVSAGGQKRSVNTYLAVTADYEPGNFGNADGVIGLAFNDLNQAYDLLPFLTDIGRSVTYPWPFKIRDSRIAIKEFKKFLDRLPKNDLTPYFSAMTQQGTLISRSIFAFYTHRSAISKETGNPSTDPLNQGLFILGGGIEQKDLYSGEFTDVKVVHDMWYNTNLLAIQVAGCPQAAVKQLDMQNAKTNVSNSIIDSGAAAMMLAPDVYEAVMSSLRDFNPALADIATEAQQDVIPAANLNPGDWPDITFMLADKDDNPVPLSCSPRTYWQFDAPEAGQAIFQILNSNGVQSILGLPLLNNYYTVFDREDDPYGRVRFAKISRPGILV
jgi:Eukaryotic aspartyl protease